MEYPVYYRKAGKCMKVVSASEAKVILLPPDVLVPQRFDTREAGLTPEQIQVHIEPLDESDENVFRAFLFSFYHSVRSEAAQVSQARQDLYQEGRLVL